MERPPKPNTKRRLRADLIALVKSDSGVAVFHCRRESWRMKGETASILRSGENAQGLR
jgi:hypothetical protein